MTSRDDVGPILNGIPTHLPDIDPSETQEWLDSLDAVIDGPGRMRARDLMLRLLGKAWDGVSYLAWYITYRVDGDQRSRPTD